MADKKEVPKNSLFISLYKKVSNLFVAERRLSDKESTLYDKFTPTNWHQKLPIIPQEMTPPASGYGYVQSPYISAWSTMWGVNPLTDLPKYRMMYRTVPIVKKAIDKTVATAISKGFELDLPPSTDKREEILSFLKSWIDQQLDFKLHLQMLASDALTYGNAFAEIVYNEIDTTERSSDEPEFNRIEIPDPHEDYKIGEHGIPYLPTVNYHGNGKYIDVKAKGDPVWIKPLDPLWMRVRRDSYGNVYGYLQYLSTPPVAFTNDKIVHIRFNPKSWWTENAYGTSNLMALIRTQEAIWTIENDLILISHACAKPPLIFSCGAIEGGPMDEPWTEGQLTSFVASTSGRGPGGDIYHRGDVQSKPLPFPASSLAPLITHLDYHVQQRMIILGVPPDLLGISGGSNRSTAMVTMDDWINTIQLLQQQMADAMEEQLFKPIIEKAFGEGTSIPKMVWNQVYEKDAQIEIQQIMVLRTSNIITTNEARAMLGDIGKKLEPVTNGDSLLPPMAFMPTEEEQEEDTKDNEKMPSEDSVLGDEVEAKAEEEFMDVKVKAPSLTEPKEEPTKALAGIQGYAEPGTPSGTGMTQKPDRKLHTLNKKGKRFLKKVAHEMYGPETIGQTNPKLRAESGNLSGQSNDDADYPKEEKELRNVKIKKLKDVGNIEVWLIDSKIAAERYDLKWDGKDNKWHAGHHLVFDYIPENHIWLSDQAPESERETIILHEYVEHGLMEQGYSYAKAHKAALRAEGLGKEEVEERSYITPDQIKKDLNKGFPNLSEKENEWDLGDRKIVLDETAGIIYVKDREKIVDQKLIRSSEDIEKFITKYKGE